MDGATASTLLYAARPVDKPVLSEPESIRSALQSGWGGATAAPLPFPLDGCLVSGLLSPGECAALVAAASGLDGGFSPWSTDEAASRFRRADTLEAACPFAAAELWARLTPLVPAAVRLGADDTDARCERGLEGDWAAAGLNHCLLFGRYGPGGHFSPHTDGATVVDWNLRSLYSVIIYLDDCPLGGGTALYAAAGDAAERPGGLYALDEGGRLRWPGVGHAWVAPCARGSALVFHQGLPHEGVPVGPGCAKTSALRG